MKTTDQQRLIRYTEGERNKVLVVEYARLLQKGCYNRVELKRLAGYLSVPLSSMTTENKALRVSRSWLPTSRRNGTRRPASVTASMCLHQRGREDRTQRASGQRRNLRLGSFNESDCFFRVSYRASSVFAGLGCDIAWFDGAIALECAGVRVVTRPASLSHQARVRRVTRPIGIRDTEARNPQFPFPRIPSWPESGSRESTFPD